VTTGTGASAAVAGADDFASDWRELRADGDIQFAPVELKTQEPPGWWRDFLEWLGDLFSPLGHALSAIGHALGMSGQALMWILVAVGVLLALYLLWRIVDPVSLAGRTRASNEPESWTPGADEALALLEDADRLAAEGRFDEATHLLLKRSVGQIAAARPDLLEPSSTAREIASLPALSQAARGAFGVIAERVERSLFALRSLNADDWHAARAAYSEFALAGPRALPA
jgi:hypothetical protein